jgi:tetratricopeptide (TPR) repeat protein
MAFVPGRSPLDAYREDIARAGVHDSLNPHESFWLLVATGLHRLSQLTGEEQRARAIAFGDALGSFLSATTGETEQNAPEGVGERLQAALTRIHEPDGADAIVAEVLAIAASVEEAGAFALAQTILMDVHHAASRAGTRNRGLIAMFLGRLSRQTGDFETAMAHYNHARQLGTDSGVHELVVRAMLGEATIARTRGNYPKARELYAAALESAETLADSALIAIARHGLMAVAEAAGDFESAICYAWQSYQAAGDTDRNRLELLAALASLCNGAGQHAAAMRAATNVVHGSRSPRFVLSALGSAALAAAGLRLAPVLQRVAERIDAWTSPALPFESGMTLVDLALAFARLGDAARAEHYSAAARSIARRSGFFQVLHRLEQIDRLVEEGTRSARPLAPTVEEVIREIEELPVEDGELALAI